MAIPDDNIIQQELLALIAAKPNKRVHASTAYDELAPLHPELTHQELTERYQNSVSKWANRVQFARLHLVNKGLLYRANEGPNASPGYWALTPTGEAAVAKHVQASKGAASNQFTDQFERTELPEKAAEQRVIIGTAFVRSPAVRMAALQRSGGQCEYCNAPGFKTLDDRIYLETHHIRPLCEGGADAISNVIALCPNHHREAHFGSQSERMRIKMQEIIYTRNAK
jgi:predicted HNH restriction endonuclease